jgi:hypothetical protein
MENTEQEQNHPMISLDINVVATMENILRVVSKRGAFEVTEFEAVSKVHNALTEALAPYLEEDNKDAEEGEETASA